MPTRRILTASVLAIAAVACEPSLPQVNPPAAVVTAIFDPLNSKIPLPNDLLLLRDPTTLGVPPAQAELLTAFHTAGGFPNDQEVAITIDFARDLINADGSLTRTKPDLDLASFTPDRLIIWGTNAAGTGRVPTDPIQASDYVASGDHGTLTLHFQGHQPWPPGSYAVLVRGGTNGVKTKAGEPVWPSQVFDLIAQDVDLTDPNNIGLLRAQVGSIGAATSLANQLNQLTLLFKLPKFGGSSTFDVADRWFPHQELAIAASFAIAPAVTQVQLDPARGLVPLPIDLLRDQSVVGGKLTPLAACTLAGTPLASCLDANGNPTGAAAGFATLDGFSTTAAILAPTSELVDANTVTGGTPDSTGKKLTGATVFLYDLTNPAAPVPVDPRTFMVEPCEFASSCSAGPRLSPLVALQPVGGTAGDASAVFRTRPLKDNTDYAVVITSGVKDKAGKALGAGTTAKVLLFENQLVASGNSLLQGIDYPTAASLEIMRQKLKPVLADLASAQGYSKDKVAMAYTFHTETIASLANLLALLPYSPTVASFTPAAPLTLVPLAPAAAYTKYGVDASAAPPPNDVQDVIEATITTLNLLDPASGAFRGDLTPTPENINVLIATPKVTNPNVPACAGALAPFSPLRCAPMVIFRHGLGSGRADMLTIAETFTSQGMVVVAIDAAKHGDRSFCSADNQCATGTCFHDPALSHQVDPPGATPGYCKNSDGSAGTLLKRSVSASCGLAGCAGQTDGIPYASGNFLIGANFFRTRDTLRQDIIDQSQLVRALAYAPSKAPPTGHKLFDFMASRGVIIDPTQIYFVGQSLGAIQGAVDVAVNPRISKAVLNVGGGTLVDIFTQSPAFTPTTNLLLGSLGIAPGTSSYLQFLVVAKTVLDPADPVNFAPHLVGDPLPNLLFGVVAGDGKGKQLPKKVLTQAAWCDQVVPNPFSFVLDSNVGSSPLPADPRFGSITGTFQLAVTAASDFNDCPFFGGAPLPAAATSHFFFTAWQPTGGSAAKQIVTRTAQHDAAAFVRSDVNPFSVISPKQ